MRIHARTILSVVCLVLLAPWAQGQTAASTALAVSGGQRANIVEGYGKLPLVFEANQGQSDSQVKFLSRGAGYTLFLTSAEAVLILQPSAVSRQPSVLRMKLLGANVNAQVAGQYELPGKSHYFIGNDPKKWHTNVRQYAKVRYANVYPGVDLVYYGNQHELEYDFVLRPGADPEQIRLGIEGASQVRLERGDLMMSSPGGAVRLRRPMIYQELNGTRQEIRGRYITKAKNEVGFQIASYDRGRTLIIDPVLAYSAYLGGSGDEAGMAIKVDSAGNAYVTGSTYSIDFPTANAIQPVSGGGIDAFVTKINADGTVLVYSTYLGGSSDEVGQSIAVDSAGNVYVTGFTRSADFPTVNPFQPTLQSWNNAFVTKINAAGSALVYSTYLGGHERETYGWGIAVDPFGNAYVAGDTRSRDFPVAHAIQPTLRAQSYFNSFVSKFNEQGSALIFSTYWGGSCGEGGSRIAADSAGNAYLGGHTCSADFPTVNPIQPMMNGEGDAYVTKFSADGQTVFYSTFLGGSGGENGWDITVDSARNAYIVGYTTSTDFPTANAIQPTSRGGNEAFVAKINANGNGFVFSTYLGGRRSDLGAAIATDSSGNAYVGGYTNSRDFPTANAMQQKNHGAYDAFMAKISGDGSALLYSTYFGGSKDESIMKDGYRDLGIAVDAADSAYVTGTTGSTNFPTTLLAFQRSLGGGADAFVAKIASESSVRVSPLKLGFGGHVLGKTSKPKPVTLSNTGTSALTINQVYIAGANAGDFAQTDNCGSSVAAGANCTISITFAPTAVGKKTAVLGISDSDPASPQAVALSGTGK